ncbi:TetR family transcriptional regulator [Pseudonocardiaceae bacterium YIM PH 21723]|nr:TetR family transcriptional regulator [Pseudonocardiaceae bacterium YIM PH 21723]
MALDREAVARASLSLLDEVGLDGLSLRNIAADLGVQAPAIYWHVKNKQELLDLMAEMILADHLGGLQALGPDDSWADWVTNLARSIRTAMLRSRDGARVVSSSYGTGATALRVVDALLHALREAGFPLPDAARGADAVLNYVLGFTLNEQLATPQPITGGGSDPEQLRELFAAEQHPSLSRALWLFADPDTDARFDHGLRLLLTGMRLARMTQA